MKKRTQLVHMGTAAILLLSLISPLILNVTAVAALGTGFPGDPYVITTCDELQAIDSNPTASYVLGNTIDCAASSSFTPIGTTTPFSGTLDGQDYSITDLTINTTQNGALFASINGATLKNFTYASGGVAGDTGGASIAYTALNATLRNVHSMVEVDGGGSTGGLVGSMTGGSIEESSYSGPLNVSATGISIGGLAAMVSGGSITDSYASGSFIMWGGNTIGGLVGSLDHGTIARAYTATTLGGAPIPSSSVGGLIGSSTGSGGSSITDSFAVGSVNAAADTVSGGIYGTSSDVITFSNTYYDATTTGQVVCGDQPSDAGCTAVNTDGTQGDYFYDVTNAPLNSWDFANMWQANTAALPTLLDPLATPPATAPTGLQVTGSSARTVTLSWQALPADGPYPVSEYDVQYKLASEDASHWTDYHSTLSTDMTVYPLVPQSSYDFRVAGVNSVGIGTFSSPVTGVTQSPTVYHVSTCLQLQAMQNDLEGLYLVDTNIDCSDTAGWNGGAGFAPITDFLGTFDGQGHRISGLYINRPTEGWMGLFGMTEGATVTDVTLYGGSVTGDREVGALIGQASNTLVKNVTSNMAVHGTEDVGGLAGVVSGSDIIDSYAAGTVNGQTDVGGLLGVVNDSNISRSYSSGSTVGIKAVGGLAGYVFGSTQITNTFSTAAISGGDYIGGLVGVLGDGGLPNPSVVSSYASGSVTSNTGESVGGLVGLLMGSVTNSFAAGLVTVPSNPSTTGGLIGLFDEMDGGSVTHSAYDVSRTGQAACDGYGCSPDDDTLPVNTNGTQPDYFWANHSNVPLETWDFSSVWVQHGDTYPTLKAFWSGSESQSVEPTTQTLVPLGPSRTEGQLHDTAMVNEVNLVHVGDATVQRSASETEEPGAPEGSQPSFSGKSVSSFAFVAGLAVFLLLFLFLARRKREKHTK